jgi:hypothetical protein
MRRDRRGDLYMFLILTTTFKFFMHVFSPLSDTRMYLRVYCLNLLAAWIAQLV